jgi:hypothetical protein
VKIERCFAQAERGEPGEFIDGDAAIANLRQRRAEQFRQLPGA